MTTNKNLLATPNLMVSAVIAGCRTFYKTNVFAQSEGIETVGSKHIMMPTHSAIEYSV